MSSSASSSAPSPSSLLDPLTLRHLHRLIDASIDEDVSTGDITTQSTISSSSISVATFLAKADGIISGINVATVVFDRIDANIVVAWTGKDGDKVKYGQVFGTARGSSRSLLVAERLVLNIMQRMSGIATMTSLYIATMNSTHTRLLDTRKTVPGMRLLDKLAVIHGGGVNHRLGLYDMVMIKDNHIEASGGIKAAVKLTCAYMDNERAAGRGLKPNGTHIDIEVEARTIDEVADVIACGSQIDRVLLDNMVTINAADRAVDTSRLVEALSLIRSSEASSSSSHRVQTEASGNVNLHTIASIALTGVDFVSVGALTHSVTALDISMKIKAESY